MFILLKKQFISFIFFIAILLILPIHNLNALGISPPNSTGQSILRGTTQIRKILIGRAPNELGDLLIEVKPDDQILPYIKEDTFTLLDGQENFEYNLEIDPGIAPNGEYKGTVSFLKVPVENLDKTEDKGGLNIVVRSGVSLSVNFSVTGEQIISYDLVDIYTRSIEVGQPLYLTYKVNNTGNVDWKPDQIDLILESTKDTTNKYYYSISSEYIKPLPPGLNEQAFALEIPFIEGEYRAHATFIKDNNLIGELVSNKFNVYAAGAFKQSGELLSISTNKEEYNALDNIKLSAIFNNTGEVPIKGILITELFKDDDLLDVFRSEENVVDIGLDNIFSQIVKLKEPGEYTFKTYVKYANKQTNILEKNILVSEPEKTLVSNLFDSLNTIVGLLIIALLTIIFAIIYAKKRNKKQLTQAQERIEQQQKLNDQNINFIEIDGEEVVVEDKKE